ncbi:MAG: SDR family oxidoreductase [Rhodobacteraceae bacterium]|nr:SDR family oxidoreductase [Paracoccaceae bacterium]
MRLVNDKIALITGAAAGIGRATALKFANEGAKVVASDVNVKGGEETVEMIKKAGGEAIFVKSDVSQSDDVKALVAETVKAYGRLDCACNIAGILGSMGPFTDQTEEDFDRVIAVNLRGTFLCIQAELGQMLKNDGGTIVNVASIAGLVGSAGISPYVASKHAVTGLTKTAALEFAQQGIRVNAVCPGGIETDMVQSFLSEEFTEEMLDGMHPIGRIGQPEEVAELMVWLCSDRSSFMTGAIIPIDGGFVAQ